MEKQKSKYIIILGNIMKDKNLTDKEKIIYSMILTLSKTSECIITNEYISNLLNISKVHSSRIINSLKNKGYIQVKMIYKQGSKQILKRVLTPINIYANTYKQNSARPINIDVKDIINKDNKIYNNKSNSHFDGERDYSNFNWDEFYANNCEKDLK